MYLANAWRDLDDSRGFEQARFQTLAEEQRENTDGSFFGKRFTQPNYSGQSAKYETDCYANLALAYLLHRHLKPRVLLSEPEQLQANLTGQHVSPECGIAYARTPQLFASFSWKTLTSTDPIGRVVPIRREDLAEWQAHNLFGRIGSVLGRKSCAHKFYFAGGR